MFVRIKKTKTLSKKEKKIRISIRFNFDPNNSKFFLSISSKIQDKNNRIKRSNDNVILNYTRYYQARFSSNFLAHREKAKTAMNDKAGSLRGRNGLEKNSWKRKDS